MSNIKFIRKRFSVVATMNWLGAVALRNKLNTGCDVVYMLLYVSRDMVSVLLLLLGYPLKECKITRTNLLVARLRMPVVLCW